MNAMRKQSPKQFEQFLKMRYEYVYEMSQKWRDAEISGLLSPIWPHCAIKASNVKDMGLMLDYSILWNLTGFPAGILPVTKVLSTEQSYTDHYQDHWTKVLNDDCQDSEGMPICLQIIGYAFEDEKVLGIMKLLSDKIQYV